MFLTSPRLYTERVLKQKIQRVRRDPSSTTGKHCYIVSELGQVNGLLYFQSDGSANAVFECIDREDPHGELESAIEAGCTIIVYIDGSPHTFATDHASYIASASCSEFISPRQRWIAAKRYGLRSHAVTRLRLESPHEFAAMIAYGFIEYAHDDAYDFICSYTKEEQALMRDSLSVQNTYHARRFDTIMSLTHSDTHPRATNAARRACKRQPPKRFPRRYKTRLIKNITILS